MFVIKHVGALIIALLIFAFAPLPVAKYDGMYHAPSLYPPLQGGYHIHQLDPQHQTQQLNLIASSLYNDDAITLFGSSELGDNGENLPYQYFPETLGVPVVAFGGGYFDIFGSYMLLQSVHTSIKPNAKIVFILSPGWFVDGHLLPFAFDKYIGGMAARTVANNGTPLGKRLLQTYVEQFASDLNFQMAYGCWYHLCGGKTGIDALSGVFTAVYQRSLQWREFILGNGKNSPHTHTAPLIQPRYKLGQKDHDWTVYLPAMQQRELSMQTNNPYGIRDDYYDTYVRYSRVGLPKSAFARMGDYGWQYQSLSALLALLQEKQANAIFVMQPLNTLGYNDISAFYPINDTVRAMIQGAGMTYLDMYDAPADSGVLRDLFHFSIYGYAKVNKFIESIYYGE